MTRRLLTLGLATAMLALAGPSARAGTVSVPSSLFDLLQPGATATVDNLVFSDFSYSPTEQVPNPSTTPPPDTKGVATTAITSPVNGLQLTGTFGSSLTSVETVRDYAFQYTVSTADGSPIASAFLLLQGTFTNKGSGLVGETFYGGTSTAGPKLGSFDNVGLDSSSSGFNGTTPLTGNFSTITVVKDIGLDTGTGTGAASLSVIQQGFGTLVVPEPMSMALLGIGLSSLFTFRRFFKRAFVA